MEFFFDTAKHKISMIDLAVEEERRWNAKFMQESIEFWGEAIPSKIKTHQKQRWCEMMRSN